MKSVRQPPQAAFLGRTYSRAVSVEGRLPVLLLRWA